MRNHLTLVALGVALGSGIGPARRVEADWTATGSLSVARGSHTTTLLQDGKVLSAGGENGTTFPVTCELYDPAAGTWETTGSISAGRYAATATLLADGKVLIAGGGNSGPAPVVAELYHPATGTWSPTGAMLGGKRAEHTAARLSDGKVLVAGGWNDSIPLSSCEVYDPASGTWSVTGSLASGRHLHAMVLLQDGRVLVTGGSAPTISSCEIYDPGTGAWSSTDSMASARGRHTATLLTNGKVLVAGGDAGGATIECEIYDPATGTWAAAGPLAAARLGHAAALLPNGNVLVTGGWQGGSFVSSCELFDPSTSVWTPTFSLLTARNGHTATFLPNGDVLVVAGGSSTAYLTSCERLATCASPDSLAALKVTKDSVLLQWADRSSDEDAFIVERRGPEDAEYKPIKSLDRNVTQFEDTELCPDATYSYRVRAVRNEHFCPYSNEVLVHTDAWLPGRLTVSKGYLTFRKKTDTWLLKVKNGVFDPGDTVLQDDVAPQDIWIAVNGRTYFGPAEPGRKVTVKAKKTGEVRSVTLRDANKNKATISLKKRSLKLTLRDVPDPVPEEGFRRVTIDTSFGAFRGTISVSGNSVGRNVNKIILQPATASLSRVSASCAE